MKRTLDEMAKIYVDVIEGPVNGFGQYCHPEFGQSHHILQRMNADFGRERTTRAVNELFATRSHTLTHGGSNDE